MRRAIERGWCLFQTRYSFDPHRKLLCEALINTDFQRWINAINAVLELGAGYGDFINFVRAARRITIDSGEIWRNTWIPMSIISSGQ